MRPTLRLTPESGWLFGLGALALAVRAATLVALPFDGLYGQDPFAYYDYAVGPLRAALLNGQPLPPFFWPPGYPLLLALGTLLVGVTPLVGQAVSLVAGSLVPVLTYLLAREAWPDAWAGQPSAGASAYLPNPAEVGFGAFRWRGFNRHPGPAWLGPGIAGLVAALNPQLWQSSIVVMSDTTGLAAATLGAWALARFWRGGRVGWLVLSAAAMGYAVLTRWAFALVALPVAGLALWKLWLIGRQRPGAALTRAAGATVVTLLVLAPVIPSTLALPTQTEVAFAGDLEVYRWNPLNALRREFVTIDGVLRYRLPNGVYYGLLPLHPYYFTPLLAAFILPGLGALLRRRPGPLALGLLLAWPAFVLGFHAGAPWQNFRFGLVALPPLAVLLGAGVVVVAGWLPARWRWALALVVLAGLAWQAWGGVQLSRFFAERKQRELAIVAAVEAQAPPDARLLTFGLTGLFSHYSRLETLELWEQTEAGLAALLADERPTLLLIDVASVEAQWQGRSPEVNYRWLRAGPGLEVIDTFAPYTLFRVECCGRD